MSEQVMDAIQDMKSRTVERNNAIRSNNKGREREADLAINRRLQELSTASTYPSSYPKAERKRAMALFETVSKQYPKTTRKGKDTILVALGERLFTCVTIKAALAAISAITLTGLAALFLNTSLYVDQYGNFAEGAELYNDDGSVTALLDTNDNGILDTAQTTDPSGAVSSSDLDFSDSIGQSVEIIAGACCVM